MLRTAKEFRNFKLRARDGDIGQAQEFYFDDHYWTVRYLVADTGSWLNGRRVLISPYALDLVDEAEQVLPVDLTKKQIEESPSLDSDQPVSRQYELEYHGYYDWPVYWSGAFMWGALAYPTRPGEGWPAPDSDSAAREEERDPHLRSTRAVTGYHIEARDGAIGHVADFIIAEETWAIRYLVIDPKSWWPGKHVLVSPQWIERVSWEESKVYVHLSREMIKNSPEFTPESLSREYETELHQHYSRPGYWADDPVGEKSPN